MTGMACFRLQRSDANPRLPSWFAAGILAGLVVGEACGSSGVGVFYSGAYPLWRPIRRQSACSSRSPRSRSPAFTPRPRSKTPLEVAAGGASRARPAKATERLRLFLASRGLNETQCQVAVMTLDGFPRRGIARELQLSMGSVNSARAAVYKCFNVHTRSELLTAIDAAMGKRRS